MPKIILISGACGCGKTTFADAYARHLVRQEHKTVYLIHGDDFHHGFIEPAATISITGSSSRKTRGISFGTDRLPIRCCGRISSGLTGTA